MSNSRLGRTARIGVSIAAALLAASCTTSQPADVSAVKVSSASQLPGAVGQTVEVRGTVRETKGRVYISGADQIDLEPAPNPADDGRRVRAVGTLNVRHLTPTTPDTSPSALETAVGREDVRVPTDRYYLTRYRILDDH